MKAGTWPMPLGATLGRKSFLRALWRMVRGEVMIYRGSKALSIDLALDASAAARAKALLPACLRQLDPLRARLILLYHPEPAFCDPYREAILAIDVRGLYGNGTHFAWMVVDDDTALLTGREWLGCPKKMAAIRFEEDASGVSIEIERRGMRVFAVRAEFEETESFKPRAVFGDRTYTVGGPGQLAWWNGIWAYRAEEKLSSERRMRASISWNQNSRDPLLAVLGPGVTPGAAQMVQLDVKRGRSLLLAGLAGMEWFGRTYDLRYR